MARSKPYKLIFRLEGTKSCLIVAFNNPSVSDLDMQLIGSELNAVADLAARIEMPVVLTFKGVERISSAFVGTIVLFKKRLTANGLRLCLSDVCPAIEDVFRRLIRPTDDGDAGNLAML